VYLRQDMVVSMNKLGILEFYGVKEGIKWLHSLVTFKDKLD